MQSLSLSVIGEFKVFCCLFEVGVYYKVIIISGLHLVDCWIGRISHQCIFIVYQVRSLTQFYSVDVSKSRISEKKCVFNKRTIKVCVSCC